MVKAVIIDDEKELRDLNRALLTDRFPQIEIVGEAASVGDGVQIIRNTKPDIVLLDIEIIGGTGFDILQQVKPYTFKLVFITAYNHFSIKAIKFSAIDYILKPVNEKEFVEAIESALQLVEKQQLELQIGNFFDHYEKKTQSKKIVLRTSDSMHIVDVSEIIYCKSDNSYTTFYLINNREVLVSKSIKEYAEMLEEFNFIRPHQSFLVNFNFISKIDKGDGGFIILQSGVEVPISARRKQSLMQILEKL